MYVYFLFHWFSGQTSKELKRNMNDGTSVFLTLVSDVNFAEFLRTPFLQNTSR